MYTPLPPNFLHLITTNWVSKQAAAGGGGVTVCDDRQEEIYTVLLERPGGGNPVTNHAPISTLVSLQMYHDEEAENKQRFDQRPAGVGRPW